MNVGRQLRRTSVRIKGGQLSEGERCLKLRPLPANHSILINSIPLFTNAFSCSKSNSILFTVPLFIQVAIP